ncbi:hypothetical protein [Noviherbaspirillum humi]|nr:hypothetical protein [Noviherbaspirillum humi]
MFNDQTLTAAGAPASGYKLWTYAAGSSSQLSTYTDSSGTVAQANPVVLNAAGFPASPIWLQSGLGYKFVLTDANGVTIRTVDNVSGVNDVGATANQWQPSGANPTYVSANSFTLAGDQTGEFHVGRRVQATVTAGTVYGTITSSAYSALTTVTLAMDAGALDVGLSAVNLSILRADKPALPYLSVAGVQKLINGGAEVAQRGAVSLTTSAQYGQVDRCAIWASGGVVSAGSLVQNTAAAVGRTGKSARASGVTLTGAGVISWRYRMEAADAIKLKNQAGSFQIAVMHDVGNAVNYTIIVRKPTAADNFTAVTTIATSSSMAVPTGTATPLAFPNIALGDCSNGLEIEVQAACGAVVTKNFDFTEWQLQEGASVTPFERRDIQSELARCQRYYEKGNYSIWSSDVGAVNYTYYTAVFFKVQKRVTPTVTATSAGQSSNFPSARVANALGPDIMQIYATSTAGGSQSYFTSTWDATAEL